VKLVAEVIQNELSKRKEFTTADVDRHLDLDSNRYLRLLGRIGFLAAHQKTAWKKDYLTTVPGKDSERFPTVWDNSSALLNFQASGTGCSCKAVTRRKSAGRMHGFHRNSLLGCAWMATRSIQSGVRPA
jgi:hypothetical protein